jgi:hypothetical protein
VTLRLLGARRSPETASLAKDDAARADGVHGVLQAYRTFNEALVRDIVEARR